MTYVTDQTSAELRAHMRSLKRMQGWHEPLADRLFKEVVEQDATIKKLEGALAAAEARNATLTNEAHENKYRAREFERQAERYRALRRGQHWSVIDGIGNTLRAEALDEAIDAAIQARAAASISTKGDGP